MKRLKLNKERHLIQSYEALEKYADWLEGAIIDGKEQTAYAITLEQQIAELKELLQRSLDLHPTIDKEDRDAFIDGGYDLLMDIKKALK